MLRKAFARILPFCLALWSTAAYAEYCLDWSSVVKKHSGSSGHCWATEQECNSYRFSRPAGDYSGGCYYRPGLYPKTGAAKAGKAGKSNDQAAQAAEEQKYKQQAQQRAEDQARQNKAFEKEKQEWAAGLKGVLPYEPANRINLKAIPPAGGAARSQLDCVARKNPDESWEKQTNDCAPVTPQVPEPPAPTAVETPDDPASLAKLLESLGQRISGSRETLAKQDQAIVAKQREIELEELKIVDPDKPKGESDALRRAREALAKAKAERAQTASELAKLEQRELAAKNKQSPQAR